MMRVRWVEYVAHVKDMRNANKTLARNPKENKSLGRSRHRLADNTETDLKETGSESVD
jgi:hypothetical protein